MVEENRLQRRVSSSLKTYTQHSQELVQPSGLGDVTLCITLPYLYLSVKVVLQVKMRQRKEKDQ